MNIQSTRTMASAAIRAFPDWPDDEAFDQAAPAPRIRVAAAAPGVMPPGVWKGDELGSQVSATVSTGWTALDAQLPGGGWPCRAITEILAPQPAVLEWRLLGGAIRRLVEAGGQVVLIGPPKPPHLPGLLHAGVTANQLIWIQTQTPAERLWVTEQMVKSDAAGAIVAWLPQARQEQIRRLHVCAQSCQAPVFLCRPEAARHESSAAPLRLQANYGLDWQLHVDVFKRRGPAMVEPLRLPSIPGGLADILTPRMLQPRRPAATGAIEVAESIQESADALGSTAPRRRQLAWH